MRWLGESKIVKAWFRALVGLDSVAHSLSTTLTSDTHLQPKSSATKPIDSDCTMATHRGYNERRLLAHDHER